jgi:hypothetical protein
MKRILIVSAAAALVLLINRSQALSQVCGPNGCGREPTVAACVACSRANKQPHWTEEGMWAACSRIVPACHAAMKKDAK